jgi:hypothetical protein
MQCIAENKSYLANTDFSRFSHLAEGMDAPGELSQFKVRRRPNFASKTFS